MNTVSQDELRLELTIKMVNILEAEDLLQESAPHLEEVIVLILILTDQQGEAHPLQLEAPDPPAVVLVP